MPPEEEAAADQGREASSSSTGSRTRSRRSIAAGRRKDPGRVTIRRLNRAEYNNTIRDLCGVDFKPADDFPADDVGYGFDNIGDVLSFPPILLEKYLAAADKILARGPQVPTKPPRVRQADVPAAEHQRHARAARRSRRTPVEDRLHVRRVGVPARSSTSPPRASTPSASAAGARRSAASSRRSIVRVDGKDVKTFTVEAAQDKPQTYEATAKFTAGEKRVAVAFTNPFEDKDAKKFREFGLEMIEIEGPFNAVAAARAGVGQAAARRAPERPRPTPRAAAEKVLANFARRAYRRPGEAGRSRPAR